MTVTGLDVTAYKLKKGLQTAENMGYIVGKITEISPPGPCKGHGDLRIVRQKYIDEKTIELLVTYEEYPKEVK